MTCSSDVDLELYDPASGNYIVGYGDLNGLISDSSAVTQNAHQGRPGHCGALTGAYAGLTVCYIGYNGSAANGGSRGDEFITATGVSAMALFEMRAKNYGGGDNTAAISWTTSDTCQTTKAHLTPPPQAQAPW